VCATSHRYTLFRSYRGPISSKKPYQDANSNKVEYALIDCELSRTRLSNTVLAELLYEKCNLEANEMTVRKKFGLTKLEDRIVPGAMAYTMSHDCDDGHGDGGDNGGGDDHGGGDDGGDDDNGGGSGKGNSGKGNSGKGKSGKGKSGKGKSGKGKSGKGKSGKGKSGKGKSGKGKSGKGNKGGKRKH
jgi:PPE-repeat protein